MRKVFDTFQGDSIKIDGRCYYYAGKTKDLATGGTVEGVFLDCNSCLASPSPSPGPSPDQYYGFSEGSGLVLGESIEGHDATLNNSSGWNAGAAPYFASRSTIEFSSAVGAQTGTTATAAAFTTAKEATFAFWMNIAGWSGSWQPAFSSGDSTDGFGVQFVSGSGERALAWMGSTTSNVQVFNIAASYGTLFESWHHIALTSEVLDASNANLRIYIDGNLAGGPNQVGSVGFTDTSNLYIGGDGARGLPLEGSLQEFLHYSYRLTDDEIGDLASATSPY